MGIFGKNDSRPPEPPPTRPVTPTLHAAAQAPHAPPVRADMSLVPRKLAPSAITMRGARMLPVSRPVDSSTTRSVAWQSPITSPATTTV